MSFNFANRVIQGEFGMKHIYFDAPQTVDLDPSFLVWLKQQKAISPNRERESNTTQLYDDPKGANIQLVEVVPPSSIFWGKSFRFEKEIALQRATGWLESVPDKKVALENLERDTAKLYRLLDAYPCLLNDFQVFVLVTGEIVHLDLDRCFEYVERIKTYFYRGPETPQETVLRRQRASANFDLLLNALRVLVYEH